jgi:hypothetical protein
MREPAIMVHVQMGQHHALHVARPDSERAQLRTDLLFGLDAKRDFPADIGMERFSGLEEMRALPGIDDDDAFAALDPPRIGRYPIRPLRVGENGEPARPAMAAAFDLRGLDADVTGLYRVNLHGGASLLLATLILS